MQQHGIMFSWQPRQGETGCAYAVMLHATSRDDKLWDEKNWITLGRHLHQIGIRTVLPWGSAQEKTRSERLCYSITDAICTPGINLGEAAALLGHAKTVIGVDTGLSHLAAALGVPTKIGRAHV